MSDIDKAILHLNRKISEREHNQTISFDDFLKILTLRPASVVRNVFQTFHDMIRTYVGEGSDEYPDDPESINYVNYDCRNLFVYDTDHPFFADRLFANRLINHVDEMKGSDRQNKIYIFEGPPGSGKSTFLNNLLLKFEEYANSDAGTRYEVVWRLDRRILAQINETQLSSFVDRLTNLLDEYELGQAELADMKNSMLRSGDYVEVTCPSHDNPLLLIPKRDRRMFFDDLFKNDEFKWKLFTDKEYEWVFRETPCTICSSIFDALIQRLPTPGDIYGMIHARPYRFNRRLGEGVTVFNPGDKPMKQNVMTNELLQHKIDILLGDSNAVKYLYSGFAKTNNGIYALMDVKSHNAERLLELHNIISEGIHKVEDLEENVRSLFIALMNPEDEKTIEGFQSFSDRIELINIPYVMDLNTEVEIYRNIFGKHIDESFLPRVLHNFARTIISTRMNITSEALLEWIGDPMKYGQFCDENLLLLKMEIYTGHIPSWLSEEDCKRLNAKRRRRIIDESEYEGVTGFSGRDSIRIFGEFYGAYARKDSLISMSSLKSFFTKWFSDPKETVPEGFLDSLLRNYNYTVLQEVKESLYYYNEEHIARELLNYMFAVNFETGSVAVCRFTNEKLEISEEFLRAVEGRLLGIVIGDNERRVFRLETQKEYASRTLTQEILAEGKDPTETGLYKSLHERYVHNLKGKVLEPFLDNANFRRAIKDFDTEAFKTYDKRIRDDVSFLINNLCTAKYHYTKQSAKEVCVYVIDNDLARRFPS
ncbi:MAG: serine protein kinase PrkA [Desulfuromonadaceae bacterium]|nr:serine protein kinase PrkA [Desulfuromonadaceae bacterium]